MRLGLMISVLMFVLIQNVASASEIRFFTHSAKEQHYLDNDGEMRGIPFSGRRAFLIELVREMMIIVGHKPKVVTNVPFKRGYRYLQNEPNVAFYNVARRTEREDSAKWVGPLQNGISSFYEATDIPQNIRTLEDAKKVDRICVLSGTSTEAFLLRNGFRNLIRSNGYDLCLKMLVRGRANLVVFNSITLPGIFASTEIDEFKISVSLKLHETRGYIAFSRDIPDTVVQTWQNALTNLMQNGKYDQLLQQFFYPE